jgi:electron transport complex protein RnfB
MSSILMAALILGISGLVLGIILAVFSQLMAVPVDQRQADIRELLPGANCGACGYTTCDGYSKVLADGSEEQINLCKPGGQQVIEDLASYMGVDASSMAQTTAMVMCQGNRDNMKKRADYKGETSCHMASLVDGGDASCGYGCLGYGDCVKVCQYDAIHVINGLAVVDPDKCTSCTMCVKECPKQIIKLVPMDKPASFVLCQNEDQALVANKVCETACISCKRCVKACPEECISIEHNRAVIDYSRCTNCGECHKVCPKDCIYSLYPPTLLTEDEKAKTRPRVLQN